MKFVKKSFLIVLFALVAVCCIALVACDGSECKEHQWEEISNTATCTEAGTLTRKCSVCGKEETLEAAALGHDWDEENATINNYPDCTKTGDGVHKCKRCKVSEPFVLDKTDHDFRTDFNKTRPATCTQPGLNVKICRTCKTTESEPTAALGHDFTGTSTIVKEATCEGKGESQITCKRTDCDGDGTNTPAVKIGEIPALGHDWQSVYTLDREPTFDEQGLRSIHCNRCEKTQNEQSIPVLQADKEVEYQFRVVRPNHEVLKVGLSDITITIKDESGATVVTSNRNNFANGVMTVSLLPKNYTATVDGLPEGYEAQPSYAVNPGGIETDLVINASLLPRDQANDSTKYQLGSVMHDYTFTDVYGKKVTLSQLLAQKKMVLLNFFFVDCSACQAEMPGLLNAYELYKDDIAIVMLDVVNYDDVGRIQRDWVRGYGVPESIYVVQDMTPASIPAGFSASDYNKIGDKFGYNTAPQNVIVDREGVVVYAEGGSTSEMQFRALFKKYSSEPYYFQTDDSTKSNLTDTVGVVEVALPKKFEW